jgi:hypothetical protein
MKIIISWVHIFCTWILSIQNTHDIHVLENMNPWNNKFHVNFEWINEASKFEMLGNNNLTISETLMPMVKNVCLRNLEIIGYYLMP